MGNIEKAHSLGQYLREFAYKTVAGIDKPYSDGHLPELKRLRNYPIRNDEALERTIKRYSNRPGEYITVYSYEKIDASGKIDYSSAKINRIYLDFDDDDDPQRAISEALITAKVLTRHKIYSHCYFSGGRGIAMYIEFKATPLKPENKKEAIALFFDMVKETVSKEYENFFGMWIKTTQPGNWGLQTLDEKVRGDIARVSRIPNTKHKSGMYCIPLKYGDMRRGFQYIKTMAKTQITMDLEGIINNCKILNETVPTIIHNLEMCVVDARKKETELREIKKKAQGLQRYTKPNRQGSITEEDIQKSKDTPITSLISGIKKGIARCPIHGDNTDHGHLYVYEKTNSWYCHICKKGGSPIDFVMESEKVDFVTAVKRIRG